MATPSTPSAPVTPPTPKPPLSTGQAIEYKAYARAFQPNQSAAVLYVIATCFYNTPGFTIFFNEKAGPTHLELLEKHPIDIIPQLVTYYIADFTSGQPLANPPRHITITEVTHWH
jgi:hypothetical protein